MFTKSVKRGLIYAILFVGIVSILRGQERQTFYHNFTVNDGLPSSEVYDCLQTVDGYLWLATDRGVARYNGHTFTVFTKNDGLADNVIFKLYEDFRHRVWFISYRRLSYYDPDKGLIRAYEYNHLLESHVDAQFISSIVMDSHNNMHIGTQNSYYIVSATGIIKDQPIDHRQLHFQEIDRQPLFFSTNKRPEHISVDFSHLKMDSIPLAQVFLHSNGLFFQPEHRTLLVFFQHQLFLLTKEAIISRSFDHTILDIAYWNDHFYIGTFQGGLMELNPSTLEITHKMLFPYSISGVAVDHEQGFWCTSIENGVYYIPSSDFEHYQLADQIADIFSVQYANNRFYFSTKNGAFYQANIGPSQLEMIDRSTPHRVTFVMSDKGNVSVSQVIRNKSEHHLFNEEKVRFEKISEVTLRSSKQVDDSKYLVGNDRGLFLINIATGKMLDSLVSEEDFPEQIHHYLGNEYWVFGRFGIYSCTIDSNTIDNFSKISNARGTGLLWIKDITLIATRGEGVLNYQQGVFKSDELNRAIGEDNYTGIARRGSQVWLSSYTGLYRYNRIDRSVKHYKQYDGLISKELTGVFVDDDQQIWVSHKRGFERLIENGETVTEFTSTVAVESLMVDGQHPIVKGQQVPLGSHVYEFYFSGICYKCRLEEGYQYRLVGLNENWQETTDRKAGFNSLEPGAYQFQVKLVRPDGTASDISSFPFEVPTPYHQTWWFRSGALVLFITVMVLLFTYRTRQIRKRHQLILDLHQQRQLSLGLQMNPHFIFNSLNAIQSYIMNHESLAATKYISRLSRLMRDYLEVSINEYIAIEEELNMLDRYVALENMRLPQELSLITSIQSAHDILKNQIPIFFLQPIIENAIWHGIAKTKQDGIITLKITASDPDTIQVTITDNGIGRPDKSPKDYQSRSTEIIERRLILLSSLYNRAFKMTFYDKRSDGNDPGTEISISLPMIGKKDETLKRPHN